MSATDTFLEAESSPDLTFLCTYTVGPQTQYTCINSIAQIPACDAKDIVELLNYHDQEFTIDHLVKIRKQRSWRTWGSCA
jgi:hypothetical protein